MKSSGDDSDENDSVDAIFDEALCDVTELALQMAGVDEIQGDLYKPRALLIGIARDLDSFNDLAAHISQYSTPKLKQFGLHPARDSDDDAAIGELGKQILGVASAGGGTTTTQTAEADSQATLGDYAQTGSDGESESEGETQQTIIFATPSRAWRLIKEIISSNEDADVARCECWDAMVVDEASMMTLPKFLLAGSGLRETGQVLVGGDHRQLPPVQKHDWTKEPRRSIRSTVPYLSALDYFRLLRGEEDVLDEEREADWHHNRDPDATEIPLHRLSETYRFGSTTADILQKAVYQQDEINYTSAFDPDPQFSLETQASNFLSAVYETSASITLVTYDSTNAYQQWNPIEELLTAVLVDALPDDVSQGVVTPHNVQRSRVKSQLLGASDSETSKGRDSDNQTIETVTGSEGRSGCDVIEWGSFGFTIHQQ